jgi:TnpA family transposase
MVILDNETELPISEHTSDTAGYTDLVFSCSTCWVCSSLTACATWEIKSSTGSTSAFAIRILAGSSGGTLKPRLILGHWDDMLRVAGSLKLGWVTASLFIAKLQSFRRALIG